jgi:Tfp pilus assembly protein FimV
MSSSPKSAAELFREAFERLKSGKPINVPVGTKVSQNNVAKEAGRHPTALKKDRYGLLITEIQAYVEAQDEEAATKRKAAGKGKRSTKKKNEDLQRQLNKAESTIEALENLVIDLKEEITCLKEGVVRKDFGK